MHLRDTGQKPVICNDCRKPPGAFGWQIFECEVCRVRIFVCPRTGCFQKTADDVMRKHYRKRRHGTFSGVPKQIIEPAATCANCSKDLSSSYYQCDLCEYVIYHCSAACSGVSLQQLIAGHRGTIHWLDPINMTRSRRHLLDETGVAYTNNGDWITAPAWVEWILINFDYEFWRPALQAAAHAKDPLGAAHAARATAQTNGHVSRRRKDGTSIAPSGAVVPVPRDPDPDIRYAYKATRPNWTAPFETYNRMRDEVVVELPDTPTHWYFHMRIGDGEAPEWAPSDTDDVELIENIPRDMRRAKRLQLIVAVQQQRQHGSLT